MGSLALDWLNLAVRWFHLIAGIGWIGSSFYFMWLDSALEAPERPKDGVEGELWMVHSGGFYQVEKRLIGPGSMPKNLHWFKWEAFLTWLSGIFLLGIVYYFSGGVYLVDASRMQLSTGAAIGISLGVILVAWLVYDFLWASRLADRRPKLVTAISFGLLYGIVYGLCQVFSGRAAFIHVGAVLGTIMVANVWIRILPAQQTMIDATRAGKKPDYTPGLRAKRRSVHNSYVTLPVIFMMLSNHYPATYGHQDNWLVLMLMIMLGASIRHVMILNSKHKNGWPWLAPAAAFLAAVVYLTAPASRAAGEQTTDDAPVTDAEIQGILTRRCVACHSTAPTDDVFTTAPNGVVFEAPEQLRVMADVVKLRVIETKTMPLANKTAMTDAERQSLATWLAQP